MAEEQQWRIEIRPAALKNLRRLSRTDRDRLTRGIEQLPDGDVRKLKSEENLWRLRVGDWRVLFSRDQASGVIDVLAVRPRGRTYR